MKNDKPLQRLSYKEKVANKNKWGKENIDYYIGLSNFGGTTTEGRDIKELYEIYNNELPEKWFHYVKNPLNSTNEDYTKFPARIRPYALLRPNIDLLLGEYGKRPFNYYVTDMSIKGYSEYMENLNNTVKQNIQDHFTNELAKLGATEEQPQEIPLPDEIKKNFHNSYKDIRASKGQDLLDFFQEELKLIEQYKKLFKDWLIAGQMFTYKGIRLDNIDYDRISSLDFDYDKSPDQDYVEDGEWAVRRLRLTAADIVDNFYEVLKNEDYEELEKGATNNSNAFYSSLQGNKDEIGSKHDVYHVTWKTQKKIGILKFPDPLTGEIQEMEVDEDYKINKELGEEIEWLWVNEVWEGYRLTDDRYVKIQAIPVQRNELNNLAACKLPYNGKRFSDTHAKNISVLEMGIPYLIMYIILQYRIELTIAKSKGKIALLDINVIPNDEDWDDEKFMYYAEATGWGFINRNQIGVDKSFNQYQVLDLSLFEHIKQLIDLSAYYKQEWDDLLGITRQRKGQVNSSDSVGGTEMATFNSSVISDATFTGFEDFIKRELQGLLDCGNLAYINGKRAVFMDNMLRTRILELLPEIMCDSQLGIFVVNSSEEKKNIEMLKASAHAFAQNKAKPSVIASVIAAKNFAQMSAELKDIEQREIELAQQMAQTEQEGEMAKLEIQKEFLQIKNDFDLVKMEREYDRKERIEYIKGDVAIHTYQGSSDVDADGVADINEIEKRAIEREQMYHDNNARLKELNLQEKDQEIKREANQVKREDIQAKKQIAEKQNETQLKVAKENKNKFDK